MAPIKDWLGGFDESTNADDAQISLQSIRSGFKSIVDSSIKYTDCRNTSDAAFWRSIKDREPN